MSRAHGFIASTLSPVSSCAGLPYCLGEFQGKKTTALDERFLSKALQVIIHEIAVRELMKPSIRVTLMKGPVRSVQGAHKSHGPS